MTGNYGDLFLGAKSREVTQFKERVEKTEDEDDESFLALPKVIKK